MARIRTIKPGFFRHEELFEAERAAGFPLRLAFAGLWTAADREGRFKWQPRALKLDCLPYDDVDFGQVLNALHRHRFIEKYEIDGVAYGFIPGWHKHQIINNREHVSDLPEPTAENIVAPDDDACPTRAPRDTEITKGKGREGKGIGKEDGTRDARPTTTDEKFEEFKKAFPKRRGANPSKPARDHWNAAIKRGADPDEIIAAVKAGVGFDREKIGTEFSPRMSTWLSEQRYADHETNVVPLTRAGFYAAFGSPELEAWSQYERSIGRTTPRDKNGGWEFPTRWPPGHDPPANESLAVAGNGA